MFSRSPRCALANTLATWVAKGWRVAGSQEERLANHAAQFPDIARPGLILQTHDGLRLDRGAGRAQLRSVTFDKIVDQRSDVLLAVSQRRQGNHRHVQPEIEILPKLAIL